MHFYKNLFRLLLLMTAKFLTRNIIKRAILVFVLAPLLYLYLSLFKNALIDDTYITLCYVRSLLSDGTWGMFSGYQANTATSPLNVVILTVFSAIIGSPIEAIVFITTFYFLIIILCLTRISELYFDNSIFGYFGSALIIFNPLLISTLGLESFLFLTIFIVSFYLFLMQKWNLFTLALAFLTLTRADGFLIFLCYFLFIPHGQVRIKFAFFYLLYVTPWYMFSWVYLGSFVPDTFLIKKWQKTWWGWDYLNGLYLYFSKYPYETLFSFSSLPLLALLLFIKNIKKYPIFLLGFIGIIHFISYSILQVPPYHWYYSTEIVMISLIAFFNIGIVFTEKLVKIKRNIIFRICFLFLPILCMYSIFIKNDFIIKEMPIHTNWARPEQYKKIAKWLNNNFYESSIFMQSEIGTLAFFSNCYLWDPFSDRIPIEKNIKINIDNGGLRAIIYKINFMFFPTNFVDKNFSYKIEAFRDRKLLDSIKGTKWKTSSRWTSESLVVFDNY